MRCRECMYCKEISLFNGVAVLYECHRYPSNYEGEFPHVDADEWCGEFKEGDKEKKCKNCIYYEPSEQSEGRCMRLQFAPYTDAPRRRKPKDIFVNEDDLCAAFKPRKRSR